MARNDVGAMLQGIKSCTRTYDAGVAVKVETALYYLKSFYSDIQNIAHRMSSVDSIKLGKYAFLNARGAAENVFISLDAIRAIPKGRSWSNSHTNRYVLCQSNYALMLNITSRISELLAQASVHWEQINQTNDYNYDTGYAWSEQLIIYNRWANSIIGDVKDCSTEFKNVLEGAMSSLEATVQTMLGNVFYRK